MKLTFLGTGTSTGVPEAGCICEICKSTDKKDKRLRCSSLIEVGNKHILIDCGPDFRYQMIRAGVMRIDAVLLTHHHYDHIGGLDDLRPYSRNQDVPIYAEAYVHKAIRRCLPYAFTDHRYPGVPQLRLNTITEEPFEIQGIPIIPIRLMHANLPILGYRIGDIAYLTDVKVIPEEEFDKLKGVKTLILDALRFKREHISHIIVPEALAYANRIAPEETYFIHMSHQIGFHEEANSRLPEHFHFAYDEQVLTL